MSLPLHQLSSAADMPSDAQRIQRIKVLIDNGFADKILISHDIHTKVRLVSLCLACMLYDDIIIMYTFSDLPEYCSGSNPQSPVLHTICLFLYFCLLPTSNYIDVD